VSEPSEPFPPQRVRGIAGKWRRGWNGTCFSGGGEGWRGEEKREGEVPFLRQWAKNLFLFRWGIGESGVKSQERRLSHSVSR